MGEGSGTTGFGTPQSMQSAAWLGLYDRPDARPTQLGDPIRPNANRRDAHGAREAMPPVRTQPLFTRLPRKACTAGRMRETMIRTPSGLGCMRSDRLYFGSPTMPSRKNG